MKSGERKGKGIIFVLAGLAPAYLYSLSLSYFCKVDKALVSSTLLSLIILLSCQKDSPNRKPLNPNGDSELAILMRDMYDEGMQLKQSVINGEEPAMKLNYHHINMATPTEAGKNASHEYLLFAKAYEASVERFKNASEAERPEAYQNMVDNCMSCHSAVCQGPMVRIKKMYLTNDELKLASQ